MPGRISENYDLSSIVFSIACNIIDVVLLEYFCAATNKDLNQLPLLIVLYLVSYVRFIS